MFPNKESEMDRRKITGAPLSNVPEVGRPDRETIIGEADFNRLHDALEIEGNIDVERFLEKIGG